MVTSFGTAWRARTIWTGGCCFKRGRRRNWRWSSGRPTRAAGIERQTPVVRQLTRSDAEFQGLLRLANLRWEAGPRVETLVEPAVLRVKERGEGKPSEGLEVLAKGADGWVGSRRK